MAHYNYIGITAYAIDKDGLNAGRFRLLDEMFDNITLSTDVSHTIPTEYENLLYTEHAQFLMDYDSVTYPDESEIPDNTPVKYTRPHVEDVTIKGISMQRIYIPAVAKDEDLIHEYILVHAKSFLKQLFGNNLISMKSKQGTEYDDFAEGKETVLMSVHR